LEQLSKDYKRIVIKIGSSLLTSKEALDHVVRQIAELMGQKLQIILVSSGAIAYGMKMLGLKKRPVKLDQLQAAASLGQSELMRFYADKFQTYDIKCAQILLTWDDLKDHGRYLNSKNTLEALLKMGALPIINENDTVSVEEIKFGDNDQLSALVASLVEADMLIIMSDVEGLRGLQNKVIKVVPQITSDIEKLARPSDKEHCVGGMQTKIAAAKITTASNISCVIVDGKTDNIVKSALSRPDECGTHFWRKDMGLTARKRWLIFCAKPKGKILVDDGAKKALLNNKSLLSVGLVKHEGRFGPGDIVEVANAKGEIFGRGKINFLSQDLDKVMGKRKMKEVIHKDDLVLMEI